MPHFANFEQDPVMGAVMLENVTPARLGRWFIYFSNPDKFSVYWFALDVANASWMEPILKHMTQKRRIGALEMMGSLLLFILAADSVQPGNMDVQIPLRPDNKGNAYSVSKRSSKKWPCSALLVELAAREHLTEVSPMSSVPIPGWVLLDRLLELKIQEG